MNRLTIQSRISIGRNPLPISQLNSILVSLLLLVLAGCGSGSGGSDASVDLPDNVLPVANAGNHQTVSESDVVTLTGNGVDSDGEIVGYQWEQISGKKVTLINSNTATATFDAPVVNDPTPLLFQLTVTDDHNGSSSEVVTITILSEEEQSEVSTISGKVTFDMIHHGVFSRGLDYNNVSVSPVRNLIVQAIDAKDRKTILASSKTSEQGAYSFALQGSRELFIRVRAELKNSNGSQYNISVVNNVEDEALYVLDAENVSVSPDRAVKLDLHAGLGWDGFKYDNQRAAAPFAILDAVYDCVRMLESANANVTLPSLEIRWSSANRSSEEMDGTIGEIITSHYSSGKKAIYLLGDADVDTDEYDRSIIMHEFAHFVEDSVSRSDSVGGMHSVSDKLDMRVAFGEGFANAFACMVAGDPDYVDSFGFKQSTGAYKNMDSNDFNSKGWYNEGSVASILYDLVDTENENNDSLSLGFKGIYDVLSTDHVSNQGVNGILSFLYYLKLRNPAVANDIALLAAAQDIEAFNLDEFASFETNDGGTQEGLPVYTPLEVNANAISIGTSVAHGSSNKLSNYRYLTLEITEAALYVIKVSAENIENDPDFKILRQGRSIKEATRPGPEEEIHVNLSVGTYCLVLHNYVDVEDPGRAGISSKFNIEVEKR